MVCVYNEYVDPVAYITRVFLLDGARKGRLAIVSTLVVVHAGSTQVVPFGFLNYNSYESITTKSLPLRSSVL